MRLSDGITQLDLPADLAWTDRFWSPVVQAAGHALDGALIVEVGTRLAGRPVTLEAGDDRAWLTLLQANQLVAWANTPGIELTLTGMRAAAPMIVVFRHQDPPALELEPLFPDADGAVGEWWMGSIKLMEV